MLIRTHTLCQRASVRSVVAATKEVHDPRTQAEVTKQRRDLRRANPRACALNPASQLLAADPAALKGRMLATIDAHLDAIYVPRWRRNV